MLKKKVKNLQEYYYQWMCKHKDDVDLLRAQLKEKDATLKETEDRLTWALNKIDELKLA